MNAMGLLINLDELKMNKCNCYSSIFNLQYIITVTFRHPSAISSTPILVSDLECDTSNQSYLTIYQCPRRSPGVSCTHSEDVALICKFPYSVGNLKFFLIILISYCQITWIANNIIVKVLLQWNLYQSGRRYPDIPLLDMLKFLRWILGNHL